MSSCCAFCVNLVLALLFAVWVEIFYPKAFSRIFVNGSLSSPVYLKRGVRQGCPLSPLHYVLISEVLSTQVRKCREIEGYLLPGAGGLQSKISQYADDATCILKSEVSLRNLLNVVGVYEPRGGGLALSSTLPRRKPRGLGAGGRIALRPLV